MSMENIRQQTGEDVITLSPSATQAETDKNL
jgi:hypothetical protein